jgi:DNA invertase Pin-like site-specific DNA recombinase
MKGVYHVAGYVKLAKLWERSREQALAYHKSYYAQKYEGNVRMILTDVYVDITGQKKLYKRTEMLRLLNDCRNGRIDCIASQSKAYLAANHEEFCYLLKYLSELEYRVDLVTEDPQYQIDTVTDPDHQREALMKMADDYVKIDPDSYEVWKRKVIEGIDKPVF